MKLEETTVPRFNLDDRTRAEISLAVLVMLFRNQKWILEEKNRVGYCDRLRKKCSSIPPQMVYLILNSLLLPRILGLTEYKLSWERNIWNMPVFESTHELLIKTLWEMVYDGLCSRGIDFRPINLSKELEHVRKTSNLFKHLHREEWSITLGHVQEFALQVCERMFHDTLGYKCTMTFTKET